MLGYNNKRGAGFALAPIAAAVLIAAAPVSAQTFAQASQPEHPAAADPSAPQTVLVAQADKVGSTTDVAQLQFTQFDEDILRQRGLSPSIAEYFRRAPRFTPGQQPVQVIVNGSELGRKQATFDAVGQLCFTPEFARAIGLVPMAQVVEMNRQARGKGEVGLDLASVPVPDLSRDGVPGACPDYRTVSPRAQVLLMPSMGTVEITVPPEHVQGVPRAFKTDTGGRGALLNYRAFTLSSQSAGVTTNRYTYVDTVAGVNVDDWILRSQQSYYRSEAVGSAPTSRTRWQSAYAQKTFEAQRQVLQAGRITTQDPLFGGVPIDGAQWFPEQALHYRGSTLAVTGVAASRARVEIRQAGALLHNTVVPPGPFSISDFPLTNRGTDLQVKVVEDSGAEQNFVVPATQLMMAADNAVREGWNLAAGRLWDQTDRHTYRGSAVLSASRGWAMGGWSGLAGGIVSRDYLSAGAAANIAFRESGRSLYAQALVSNDSNRDLSGAQLGLAFGQSLSQMLGRSQSQDVRLGLSANLRSSGYRALQESQAYYQSEPHIAYGYRSQLGATLGWSAGELGSFSAGATRENYFWGEPGHYFTLGWSKGWRNGVSLNMNVSRSTTRRTVLDPLNPAAGTGLVGGSDYAYVGLSVPLGAGIQSRSFVQKADDTLRYGTSVNQRVNEYAAYTASVERQQHEGSDGTNTSSLTASLLPRYASVSLGLTRGQGYGSHYGEVSGAVLATDAGVAFSPYAVQDSFATVSTGEMTGVRIETPLGPVWSGPGGLAAVPALTPYYESRIEVAGRSVPLDVEVDNGLQVVQVGRGAVLKMDVGARRVSRLMLAVSGPDGQPLPAGTAILRGSSDFFNAVASGGRVLVTDLKPDDVMYAELASGQRCTLQDIRTDARADDQLFQSGTASCK